MTRPITEWVDVNGDVSIIARESGVIVTDAAGNPVNAKLAVEPDVDWVGYANPQIRAQIEPLLQQSLRKRKLL